MKVSILLYPRALSYDKDWATALAAHYGDYEMIRLDGAPVDITGDVCVVLHSVTAQGVRMPYWAGQQLRHRKGKLAILTGNDYKHFADKQTLADALGADVIGALIPDPPYKVGKVGKVIHLPHAMGMSRKFGELEHDKRPILVGFRGVRYPADLGDTQRNDAVGAFMDVKGCDVQWGLFEDPEEYFRHLGLSKATVASEGGRPGMKAVTSRHFDAIGARAALIMPLGDYSGCLAPEHYVPLADDLSNVDECLDTIRDSRRCEDITTAALEHCMEHHTYPQRMETLDQALWH